VAGGDDARRSLLCRLLELSELTTTDIATAAATAATAATTSATIDGASKVCRRTCIGSGSDRGDSDIRSNTVGCAICSRGSGS
jgi:hypothetical protein